MDDSSEGPVPVTAPEGLPEAFYVPSGEDCYIATEATQGPWDPRLQHGGPPAALLAAAVEQHAGRPGLRVARISVDFLGPVPVGEVSVTVKVLRPGRRIQLVEAELQHEGRTAAVARAWQHAVAVTAPDAGGGVPGTPSTSAEDGSVVGTSATRAQGADAAGATAGAPDTAGDSGLPRRTPTEPAPALPPAGVTNSVLLADFGYGRATEWRTTSGATDAFGPAAVWMRMRVPLISGRPTSGLTRMLVTADSANGVSVELPITEWLSMPTSVNVAVLRVPEGEWVHMGARTHLSGDGVGLTVAELADDGGLLGTVAQPLLVERRPRQ